MRLKKDDLERNRQEIPGAAQKLFRERGFDGVGVSDLMKAAGFTRGAFYNHFASRDQLAGEAAAAAFARSNAALAEALDKKGTGGWGDRGDRADNAPSVHSPHLTTPPSRGRNTPCVGAKHAVSS
jgi:AcrR family transcriptional regulator